MKPLKTFKEYVKYKIPQIRINIPEVFQDKRAEKDMSFSALFYLKTMNFINARVSALGFK